MERKPAYTLKQPLWTIKDCSAVKFTPSVIVFNKGNDNDEINVRYGENVYDLIKEEHCFPSKEALLHHISNSDE